MTPIQMIHAPVLVACVLLLVFLYRFWRCIELLGYTREVGRRAPMLVHKDILTATAALVPFGLATCDWFRLVDLPSMLLGWSSVGCFFVAAQLICTNGERMAASWAGSRESALRTVAMLRIIDAAQLAHALEVCQRYEVHGEFDAGEVIDMEASWSKQ